MNPAVQTTLWTICGTATGAAATLVVMNLHGGRPQRAAAPQAARRPAEASLLIANEPSLGNPNAPITIVEFSDFECPYCKRFHDETLPKLKSQYIDAGLVRFLHKDLPLPFHNYAHRAAQVARCSQEKQSYWITYNALLSKQNCLGCLGPEGIAASTGIKTIQLSRCLKRGQAAKVVNTNISEAQLAGIKGTPTIVVGKTQMQGHKGEVIEGALAWPQFETVIKRHLSPTKQQ